MANQEHLAVLKHGVNTWNQWRKEHPDIQPDLSEADLWRAYLSIANLSGADLRIPDHSIVNLTIADLIEANLSKALQLHLLTQQ